MTDVVARLATALADRYVIEHELGAGGMATVYQARDLRHHRPVALKVLRPELAAVIGADRFLHEITTTANLQHPHILPLHDSGSVDGTVFYVMPFVEGESLRDRLVREKQLPVDDAVRIAREVAGALDYAHRHGVIHRDIKPENILLHDGQALVADFGIALAAARTGDHRMTETGMSLGTPTYMSPEQAMGERGLDARTDVYALGCVLYEMLTGEPPFTGPTAQSIVAKVLTEPPRAVRSLRTSVPLHVDAAISRALEKLPADRFGSAAEFGHALADTGFRTPAAATADASPVRTARSRGNLISAALIVGLAVLAAWGWLRPVPERKVTRFYALLDKADLSQGSDAPEISPDGRHLVYVDSRNGLWLRRVDQLEATPIQGGSPAWAPFFSPDGNSLGFATGFPGDLRILTLATSSAVTIAKDSVVAEGATWSDDGWVYYVAGSPQVLRRVRPTGGDPEPILRADSAREELAIRWPLALPGGQAVLVTIGYRRQPPAIAMVDIAKREARVIASGVRAWFTPTGHLVVVRNDGSVAAARFSPRRGALTGQFAELIPRGGVWVSYGGRPTFGLSRSGMIAYMPALSADRVVRVTRSGGISTVDPTWEGEYSSLSLSPDGSRLVVSMVVDGRGELWLKQLDDGPLTRLWAFGSQNFRPFWSGDGKQVGFSSDASGVSALYRTMADGSMAERIAVSSRTVDEGVWSRDGGWLLFRAGSGGGRDIFGIRPGVDTVPVPLVVTDAEEYSPTLSPDGRWLAYGSEESGRSEIYVRPFPQTSAGRVQVSVAGGTEPLWANSGRELFYRDDAGDLVSVSAVPGPEFRVQSRRALFSTRDFESDTRNRLYAVSPDDSWFLFALRTAPRTNEVIIVENWFEELKTRVP